MRERHLESEKDSVFQSKLWRYACGAEAIILGELQTEEVIVGTEVEWSPGSLPCRMNENRRGKEVKLQKI